MLGALVLHDDVVHRVGDHHRVGERVDHLLITAALLTHSLVAALDVEVRRNPRDHRTGVHHDRADVVQQLGWERCVDDDDAARRVGESAALALHQPNAAAEGSQHFRGVRFRPERWRTAIVRTRHRKRGPFVELNPGRRSRRRVADYGRLRQRCDHPRMRALGDRQLERPVIETRLRHEDELLLRRVESEQTRSARAARREDVAQQESCGRVHVWGFGQSGQQRQLGAIARRPRLGDGN